MQRNRGGSASSGYVSSGYFAGMLYLTSLELALMARSPTGLMLGRTLLLWLNKKVGT